MLRNQYLIQLRETLAESEQDYLHRSKGLATIVNLILESNISEKEKILELKDASMEYYNIINEYLSVLKEIKPTPFSKEKEHLDNVLNSINDFNHLTKTLDSNILFNNSKFLSDQIFNYADNMFNSYTALCLYLDIELKNKE